MQQDLFWDIDVAFPYKQVWRGKEVANDMIYNSVITSYELLFWYLEKVLQTNSGSIVLVKSEEDHFKRAFFYFGELL